jgi:trans-aconitate methyltransferase
MLAEARRKLPQVECVLANLRDGWPSALPPLFDRIVSGYVFHHIDLPEKVRIMDELAAHLVRGGRLAIADIAFLNLAAQEAVRREAGEDWEDEFYWLVDEIIPALQAAGLAAAFTPVSNCTGVFLVEKP